MYQESTATSSGSGTVSLSAEGSTGNMLNSQEMQNLGKKGKTYIVKFADVPVAEINKKFEIVGVKDHLQVEKTKSMEAPKTTDVPEDVQTALEIVTGVTRSKRQVKTPKRLLDMDSTPKKTLKTKEANKISDQDSVLILPRISISNLNKNDLYIEMEIDSEYSVGPLELVSKEREKSKYGIKVTKAVSELKDVVKVDDGNMGEEMDIEHTEGEEIMLRISNIETSDILFETESQKVSSSGKSPKSSKSSQKSPKKQLKKQAVKKKNGPKSASKKKDKVKSKTINGDKSDKTQTETQDDKTEETEQTSFPEATDDTVEDDPAVAEHSKLGIIVKMEQDANEKASQSEMDFLEATDDIDDTVEDDPAVEEERSETGSIVKIEQDADQKVSQSEMDYESEKLEQKQAKASRKSKRVQKKKNPEKPVDDSKQKRKYTKSSAYNRDNSHYTVVTNDEGKKVFKCEFCGLEQMLGGNMRDHIRIHTGDKPFACEVCGKTFSSNNNLRYHRVTHSDKRPFVCDICGLTFKKNGLMKTHRSRHDPTSSRFMCHMCGKNFHSSNEVRAHMSTHTEEKKFECQICHKRYSQSSTLARHRFVHTAKKPHPCQFCDMSFVRKEIYVRHMKKYHSDVNLEDNNKKTEVSNPSEIVIGIEDEASEASEHLLNSETVYIQVDGKNYEVPYMAPNKRDLYQSEDIPLQQGEIIIVTETNTSELVKSMDYTQVFDELS